MRLPDHTAVRVALWRALHLQIDSLPHVFEDDVGLKLAAPEEGWQARGDMHPVGTQGYRAAIVARARYIEDLVLEEVSKGVNQYVILGAGLDTFAQRKPEMLSKLHLFEIDMPATQNWKRKRLEDLGFSIPQNLHFVPVDFEAGDSLWEKLRAGGFDKMRPAVVASTGVSMYLTKEANRESLRQMAELASGSTLALTFTLPLDLLDPAERPQHEMVYERARAAGTPFLSFFQPEEIVEIARSLGFRDVKHVSGDHLATLYFAGRVDGMRPSKGEDFLICST